MVPHGLNMQALLFDMDVVLYNSEEPIPEAAETLAWIRSREIPHLFVNHFARTRWVGLEIGALRDTEQPQLDHDAV